MLRRFRGDFFWVPKSSFSGSGAPGLSSIRAVRERRERAARWAEVRRHDTRTPPIAPSTSRIAVSAFSLKPPEINPAVCGQTLCRCPSFPCHTSSSFALQTIFQAAPKIVVIGMQYARTGWGERKSHTGRCYLLLLRLCCLAPLRNRPLRIDLSQPKNRFRRRVDRDRRPLPARLLSRVAKKGARVSLTWLRSSAREPWAKPRACAAYGRAGCLGRRIPARSI